MCERKRDEACLEGLKCLNKELVVALSMSFNCYTVVFIESTLLLCSKNPFNHVSAMSNF